MNVTVIFGDYTDGEQFTMRLSQGGLHLSCQSSIFPWHDGGIRVYVGADVVMESDTLGHLRIREANFMDESFTVVVGGKWGS